MLWAAVPDPQLRMAALHDAVDEALAGMPIRQENRAFRPHVTLARVKAIRDVPGFRRAAAPLAEEDFGRQPAAEVVAYTSRLTPNGPVYTPVARARLGG
jgi:2'-5' RNA ligase